MSIIDKVKEMLSNTAERLQSIPKQRHAKTHKTMGDVTDRGRETFEGTEGRLGEGRLGEGRFGEETGRRPEGPDDITGGTGGAGPR
ncbi:hypothetical protein [Microtetraspora niveoalba]|uniref:hypothetical protein n=1 Tax=Microtetraspora niveoalba TaxID=46175 RepID=UPI000835BB36|nr:hypothetical protein [Microtetraspora niveoalba]